MARPKGSENKFSASAKEAFSKAFEGSGGIVELIAWAKENRTDFYKLYSKIIPVDVKMDANVKHEFEPLVIKGIENKTIINGTNT